MALRAGAQAPAPGYGSVSGSASSTFLLSAPAVPAPPAYSNDGYRQAVTSDAGAWRVEVKVDASPLKVRVPFSPRKIPPSLHLPQALSSRLAGAIAPCQRADEAVDAVLVTLRRNIRYVEKARFAETEAEVAERGEGSCVGMTRLSVAILRSLGVDCREVIGLKLPVREGNVTLAGGLLHAWLEVDYAGGPTVFCDPWRSSGWVPETYLVLRVGGGYEPGPLSAYAGGTARCLAHADRIFYEPQPGVKADLWRRSGGRSATGASLAGKLLGPLDAPLTGAVRLAGPSGDVSEELWEGNFFFGDLQAAQYEIAVVPLGEPPQRASVRLAPMDRRTLVFYSQRLMGTPSGAKP